MEAYVANTWQGVQCPHCRRGFTFPWRPLHVPRCGRRFADLQTKAGSPTSSYGGDRNVVGDLKIEVKLTLETAGTLRLEAGNSLRRAAWNIPRNAAGESDEGPAIDSERPGQDSLYVQKKTPAFAPGEHTLTLAYDDGDRHRRA